LDSIDIHIEIPWVDYKKLNDDGFGEPSATIQVWVETSRRLQRISGNSNIHPAEIRKHCQLDDTCRSLMRLVMSLMQLSTRRTTGSSSSRAPSQI